MVEVQRQLGLRNKEVPITNPIKKNIIQHSANNDNKATIEKDNVDKEHLEVQKGKKPMVEVVNKVPEVRKETTILKENLTSFNLENEISKIKISLPFNEILRNYEYRGQLIKMLKTDEISVSTNIQSLSNSDIINLQDDKPTILFGPRVENQDEDEVPPFYISLRIHNMFLHNTMLDSGASHNLMPKVIMDNLGLDITKPYKYLYSFDSRKVKCIGLIKDLVVSLHQIPEKSIFIDVVVADVPVKVGMLLSRSCATKLKGTLQMDIPYATIPVFVEQSRLYRENRLTYMIRSPECPQNHPIYSIDTELGSSIFCNESAKEQSKNMVLIKKTETKAQVEIKEVLQI